MYNELHIIEKLENILMALERIPRRFAEIEFPTDFRKDDEGIDKLDAICMSLIAVGESFKKIDNDTAGKLLEKYPEIDWRGVIGVRNVIAHGYFDVDAEEVFEICQDDIPTLIAILKKMIVDLR